jgi:hypothetical protein
MMTWSVLVTITPEVLHRMSLEAISADASLYKLADHYN